MTPGEMISRYRREKKLSQEELGNMLNVSRQTVSLWETGQTVPTIDNLVRLKEIFGVSVDRLLGCEEVTEEVLPEEPRERYRFRFDKKELRRINLRLCLKNIIGWIIAPLIWFAFFAMNVGENGEAFIGIIFGIFLASVFSAVVKFVRLGLGSKKMIAATVPNTYDYSFFDDHILVAVERDGETIRTMKLNYKEIESAAELDKYYVLFTGNRSYMIKKESLGEASAVVGAFETLKCRKRRLTSPKLASIASIILFILTLAAWPLACMVTTRAFEGAVSGAGSMKEQMSIILDHTWIFFTFIPIPASSVLFGFFARKKGLPGWKKNVIAGIIVFFILLGFGLFVLYPRA